MPDSNFYSKNPNYYILGKLDLLQTLEIFLMCCRSEMNNASSIMKEQQSENVRLRY